MPTWEAGARFLSEYGHLTPHEQEIFARTRDECVRILRGWELTGSHGVPHFPNRLGVKPMASERGIFEFAWAPDGRCTWQYGAARRAGMCHVVWRRIGSHRIYDDP